MLSPIKKIVMRSRFGFYLILTHITLASFNYFSFGGIYGVLLYLCVFGFYCVIRDVISLWRQDKEINSYKNEIEHLKRCGAAMDIIIQEASVIRDSLLTQQIR
jgi:uncharacterized membrane protein